MQGISAKGSLRKLPALALRYVQILAAALLLLRRGFFPSTTGLPPIAIMPSIGLRPREVSINGCAIPFTPIDRKDLYSLMDREAERVTAGCDGLLLLPYLSGMNYPANEELARGVFSGLSLQHTRAYFARAVLESVAFLLRQSIEEVTGYGMEASGIYSLGGGAGDLWCQIKADVTGKSIHTIDVDEVACHGAAMLAAVGSGLFLSYEEAVSAVREKQVYRPVQPALYEGIYLNFLNKNKHYIAEMRAHFLKEK